MVPPCSHRIPRVRWYSGSCSGMSVFVYETITLFGWASHPILLTSMLLYAVRTPRVLLLSVWPLPLSLATTRGISVDFFSSRYLDVSVPGVPHITLWIHVMLHDYSPWVFPHSEICGSKLICSSPQLIAACHVLLRLLMPRHSPYALVRLNFLLYRSLPILIGSLFELSEFLLNFYVQGFLLTLFRCEKTLLASFDAVAFCTCYFELFHLVGEIVFSLFVWKDE